MGLLSRLFSRKQEEPQKPAEPEVPEGAKTVWHSVAGTNYHQDTLLAMGVKDPAYNLNKRDLVKRWPNGVTVYEYKFNPKKAELVPEPDNPHDPKAIKVLIDGQHVGYIKAGSCAHIHKLLRENRILKIRPRIIGGKSKAVYCHDEYSIREGRVSDYELEKDETTIGVRLEITELPPVTR